jgi:6-phosphogluconolactonase
VADVTQPTPSRGELVVVETPADVATAAAKDLVAAAANRERFTLALSGGSTPRSLYRLLGDPTAPFRSRLDWSQIHFFWGDERHVPPQHPDSNFRMVREALLDELPVPPGNIHRIRAEEKDASTAAAEYEEELRRFFGLRPGGVPRFDYVLLGLGEEGHTASLFPGSPVLHETKHLVAAPWVAAQQTFRITLTPPVLNAAARVAFLVAGAAKAAALHAVLDGVRHPDEIPAQIVAPTDGSLVWFVDRAAAIQVAPDGSLDTTH